MPALDVSWPLTATILRSVVPRDKWAMKELKDRMAMAFAVFTWNIANESGHDNSW